MKKPGKPKPKPKRRARPQPAAPSSARRSVMLARSSPILPAPKASAQALAFPNSPLQSHEDRTRLALLLLPFLIIAVSLAMAQMRRNALPALPEIAAPGAIEKIASAPSILLPRTTPTLPEPKDAVLPPQVAAPVATPAPTIAPVAPPVQFPPPLPALQPAVPPTPAPAITVTAPLPAFAAYPPPQARMEAAPASSSPPQQVAVLDVRPPSPPVALPASPPAPPAAATPATPPASDTGFCAPSPSVLASFSNAGRLARAQRLPRLTGVDPETFGRRLAAAAVAQTEDLVIYTARYQAMAYPMGDVLTLHGACIDVVIRAYRTLGIDLQEEVQRARPSRGDTNIDHRRTENMRRFLEKNGASLPVTQFPEDYKPGDIVTYHRPFSRVSTSHIAIVTDILAPTGRPMIVHNRGYGPQLEDALFVDRITGHYRYTGSPAVNANGEKSTPAGVTGSVVRAGYSAPATTAR